MASSWDKLGQAASVMQMTGVDAFGLVSMIVQAANTARSNRDLCQLLAQHVLTVGGLLRRLEIPELMRYAETRRPLEQLNDALFRAYKLVRYCSQQQENTSKLYQLFTGADVASKLRQAQEEIDRYISLIPMITTVAVVCSRDANEVYEDVTNDSDLPTQRPRLSLQEVTQSLALEEVLPRGEATKNGWHLMIENVRSSFSSRKEWHLRARASEKGSGGAPQLKRARLLSFEELKNATNNFSNEIGSGGYGKVYKGTLADGTLVAIKRAEPGSMQGVVEFKNEIELLSRVHHKNLVSLIGFCYKHGELMLVYEYISNGTLRENLLMRGTHLDWKKRLRIALGSARGLAYLHEIAHPPIIHRDINSTNILLDDNLKAKVADFGLSKRHKGQVSTTVKATLGYLDPEYYMTQQLSKKSDVYSFGVVMLELVNGRQPIEAGKYIVREVHLAIDSNNRDHYGLQNLLDPAIRDAARTAGFRRFVQLAMRCVDESAAARPTMVEVMMEMEAMLQNEVAEVEGANSVESSANEFDSVEGGARSHPNNNIENTRG